MVAIIISTDSHELYSNLPNNYTTIVLLATNSVFQYCVTMRHVFDE